MADDADRARRIEDLLARIAVEGPVAAIRAALARPGAARCVDCGEPIPENRRAAQSSAIRCAPCQGQFEGEKRWT